MASSQKTGIRVSFAKRKAKKKTTNKTSKIITLGFLNTINLLYFFASFHQEPSIFYIFQKNHLSERKLSLEPSAKIPLKSFSFFLEQYPYLPR